jgi:hypothetical protein
VRSLLCSSALAMVLSHACAHEVGCVGCVGKPPNAVIKASCWGDHDWARLQPGQWREDGGVYFVLLDGAWHPVLYSSQGEPIKPLPSTDGCDYVWYRRQGENAYWNDDETAHAGLGEIRFFCLQLSMAF